MSYLKVDYDGPKNNNNYNVGIIHYVTDRTMKMIVIHRILRSNHRLRR